MPYGPSPPPCLGLLAVAFLMRYVRVLIRILPFVLLALAMQPQLLTRSPLTKLTPFWLHFLMFWVSISEVIWRLWEHFWRLWAISGCFDRAIENHGYRGRYRPVYPIKVNQQRHVVEEIVQFGSSLGVGLEAGSRPELLIALALLEQPGAPIVCNGYKDQAYVETALLAQRLGRHPILVIDRFRELDRVIQAARDLGIRPHIGLRARLMARGAG